MKIIVAQDKKTFYGISAAQVAAQLGRKPDSVIGLALGTTTLGVHRELVRMNRFGGLDFHRVVMFIVDETMGIRKEHPSTGYARIHEQLFDRINIKAENSFTPDTLAADGDKECAEYERRIASFGGIDLQMLGIGANGHVGFDEPGTPFETLAHIVNISERARQIKLPYFSSIDEVPRQGITLGIKSIMMAENILLMAKGSEKAEIIAKALFGSITTDIPASALQLHRSLTVVLDAAAAELIMDRMA